MLLLNGGHRGGVVKVNKRLLMRTAERVWPSLRGDRAIREYFARVVPHLVTEAIESGFLEELGFEVLERRAGSILLIRNR